MLPETLQLEQLHQQIDDAEYEIGNQSDYLGYGKPNAKETQQAEELITRMKAQSQAARTELQQLITQLRTGKPEAFDEWINLHKDLLNKIIAEPITDTNSKVRQNVARETLQAWEKVQAGEEIYVNINWHFLKDYKAKLKTLGGKPASANPTVIKKEAKPWWKIW